MTALRLVASHGGGRPPYGRSVYRLWAGPQVLEDVLGTKPLFFRMGGSIPAVGCTILSSP